MLLRDAFNHQGGTGHSREVSTVTSHKKEPHRPAGPRLGPESTRGGVSAVGQLSFPLTSVWVHI